MGRKNVVTTLAANHAVAIGALRTVGAKFLEPVAMAGLIAIRCRMVGGCYGNRGGHVNLPPKAADLIGKPASPPLKFEAMSRREPVGTRGGFVKRLGRPNFVSNLPGVGEGEDLPI